MVTGHNITQQEHVLYVMYNSNKKVVTSCQYLVDLK